MYQAGLVARKYSSLTPCNYSFNMPNMVVDVNGADPADNGGRDPANYWFEESMQRRAAQGKGEPQSNTFNYFDRLFTRSQMMERFRAVGGNGMITNPGIFSDDAWAQIGGVVNDMWVRTDRRDGISVMNANGIVLYKGVGWGLYEGSNGSIAVASSSAVAMIVGIGKGKLLRPKVETIAKSDIPGPFWRRGYGGGPMSEEPLLTQGKLPSPEELYQRFGASFSEWAGPITKKYDGKSFKLSDLINDLGTFDPSVLRDDGLPDVPNSKFQYVLRTVWGRLDVMTADEKKTTITQEYFFNNIQYSPTYMGTVINPGLGVVIMTNTDMPGQLIVWGIKLEVTNIN